MTFLMLRRLLNAEASSVLVCMLQATPAVDWICVAQASVSAIVETHPWILPKAYWSCSRQSRVSQPRIVVVSTTTQMRGVAGITA